MRALIIENKDKESIASVIKYAEEHIVTQQMLKDVMTNKIRPVGDDANYMCYFDQGYRVVYSIEEQPIGKCRHISVSVDDSKKLPNEAAVEIIMKEFGFKKGIINSLNVWIEENIETPLGLTVSAINVLQEY